MSLMVTLTKAGSLVAPARLVTTRLNRKRVGAATSGPTNLGRAGFAMSRTMRGSAGDTWFHSNVSGVRAGS